VFANSANLGHLEIRQDLSNAIHAMLGFLPVQVRLCVSNVSRTHMLKFLVRGFVAPAHIRFQAMSEAKSAFLAQMDSFCRTPVQLKMIYSRTLLITARNAHLRSCAMQTPHSKVSLSQNVPGELHLSHPEFMIATSPRRDSPHALGAREEQKGLKVMANTVSQGIAGHCARCALIQPNITTD
jgi:hypothetical protein